MMNTQLENKIQATTQTKQAEKTLSMNPSAVRSRAKRAATAALKESASDVVVKSVAKTRKQPTAAPIKVSAAQKRTIGQLCASIAAGFLPIASFVLAHFETKTQPMLWILVAAALMFSAPTLADWARKWCGNMFKAWGFTILLEGVMVFSHTVELGYAGLVILVAINASNAWGLAARKVVAE